MEIDLKGKSFCLLGVRQSGKSTFANKILNSYQENAIYYDTLHECPADVSFDVYQPKDKYSVLELETLIRTITPKNTNGIPLYKMIIIDECNRFALPKPASLPAALADLNDCCRHYLMSAGYIARRPVQLHSDLIELADYIFIFRLTGKNDILYLNNLSASLGDTVMNLQQYEFVTVNPDKSYVVSNPITPDKSWVKYAKRLIDR